MATTKAIKKFEDVSGMRTVNGKDYEVAVQVMTNSGKADVIKAVQNINKAVIRDGQSLILVVRLNEISYYSNKLKRDVQNYKPIGSKRNRWGGYFSDIADTSGNLYTFDATLKPSGEMVKDLKPVALKPTEISPDLQEEFEEFLKYKASQKAKA